MIDNLKDAIAHERKEADGYTKTANAISQDFYQVSLNCQELANYHGQLSAWLEELKAVKDIVDHWNDENSSFVSATIAFEKILDVFKESEAENE